MASAVCPNEPLRTGKSAGLPDCRAYELVTPNISNGRETTAFASAFRFNLFPIELASPVRDSVLYMTLGQPMPGVANPNGTYDLYEAVRDSNGWQTVRRLSPSGEEAVFPNAGGVSMDHLYDFTEVGPVQQVKSGGTLAEQGDTSYLGNPDGNFEVLGVGALGEERIAQGRYISPAGNHIIFTTGSGTGWCSFISCPAQQLEPNAPPTGTSAIYDRTADGATRVVSMLPGEVTPAAGEGAEYQGVSSDGRVVAFKIGGILYVRVDNSVTKEVTEAETIFAGISQDGSRVFYLSGGNLFAFNIAGEETIQATESSNVEVVNVSSDGSRVYFTSASLLNGSEGTEGEPNLYVWRVDADAMGYVATVSSSDLSAFPGLTTWTTNVVSPDNFANEGPGASSARATPDGTILSFESRAQLTAYPSEGHTEIYRYDDQSGDIVCASCNPSGASATADARFEAVNESSIDPIVAVHNLTVDGSRIFFETAESLVKRDTDEVNDIYQWRHGSEPEISLISSGQSPRYHHSLFGNTLLTNVIYSVTPSGQDVIFSAREALVPAAGEGGVPALYDARIGGGFPESLSVSCFGDSCQPPSSPPKLSAASSRRFMGKGNVKPRRRCKYRKRRQHHREKRCAKRRHKQQQTRLTGDRENKGASK